MKYNLIFENENWKALPELEKSAVTVSLDIPIPPEYTLVGAATRAICNNCGREQILTKRDQTSLYGATEKKCPSCKEENSQTLFFLPYQPTLNEGDAFHLFTDVKGTLAFTSFQVKDGKLVKNRCSIIAKTNTKENL